MRQLLPLWVSYSSKWEPFSYVDVRARDRNRRRTSYDCVIVLSLLYNSGDGGDSSGNVA